MLCPYCGANVGEKSSACETCQNKGISAPSTSPIQSAGTHSFGQLSQEEESPKPWLFVMLVMTCIVALGAAAFFLFSRPVVKEELSETRVLEQVEYIPPAPTVTPTVEESGPPPGSFKVNEVEVTLNSSLALLDEPRQRFEIGFYEEVLDQEQREELRKFSSLAQGSPKPDLLLTLRFRENASACDVEKLQEYIVTFREKRLPLGFPGAQKQLELFRAGTWRSRPEIPIFSCAGEEERLFLAAGFSGTADTAKLGAEVSLTWQLAANTEVWRAKR